MPSVRLMRFWTPLAFAAVIGLPVAAPARATDMVLAQEDLLAVIQGGQTWCESWRDKDDSCEHTEITEMLPGDQVRRTSHFRLADNPDLQMVVYEKRSVEGRALCVTFRFSEMEIVTLIDGQPATKEQAAPLLAKLAEAMADLEGKKVCEAYARDDETGVVRSTTTVAGRAAPEFDSVFRLIKPNPGTPIRPLF